MVFVGGINQESCAFGHALVEFIWKRSSMEMKKLYSKTVGYLKNSHSSPKVEAGEDVLEVDAAEGQLLES